MTPELLDAALVVVIAGLIAWLGRRVIRKQREEETLIMRNWYFDEGGEG